MEETEDLIIVDEKLRSFVDRYVKGISSSQLRKIYDEILTKETDREIQLLRPVFAYTIARQPTDGAKRVMLLIDDLAKKVIDHKSVLGFKRFMETLVAYHKYYEVLKN